MPRNQQYILWCYSPQFEPSWRSGSTKYQGLSLFSNCLPTFLGLTRISALLPGQFVLKYSILMSMTRKSSGSQLWSSTTISLLKKNGMCLDIRHNWLLHICLLVSAPCSPNFQKKKKSFQATLFRHQICAALILSFIFKLPLESCNSQMLCLL